MILRVIDCHAHLGHFARTDIIYPDAQSMIRAMDASGVEKLCVSSFLSIGPDYLAGNDMVAAAVRRYPDRFVGYAVVNPNRPQGIQSELDRCFQQLGMRAIKVHPAFHAYSIEGSAYRKVFEYATKYSLPVLSHEWGRSEFLEKVSADYPKANLIIAHTGFWDGRSDFIYRGVLQRRPNVFVDLAYSTIYYDALERMVADVSAEKILWGSDFPLHDLAFQLGRVTFAKLDAASKEKILGGNMLRLLGE
jgi:predicted TIM-barrel fold metal-dependent hydrolase